MATELKSPPTQKISRSERMVEDQIQKIEKQIRLVDLGTGVLGLLALFFAYTVVIVLLDRFLALSSLARQFLFAGFVLYSGWWVYKKILTPLLLPVNPIYAALLLEQAIPDTKNSLVNYVDLKDSVIPESVKLALGKRAAKDLKSHDEDEFVSHKNLFMLGTLAGFLFFILIILAVIFGKNPFFSLLGRTFTPFVETTIATRNTVLILNPEQGNVTISMGVPIEIVAKVTGKLPSSGSPDSPRLMMRYHENEPWQTKFMGPGDISSEHKIRIPSSDVRSGFAYRVVAGDSKSKDYQVDVRLTPLISDFQTVYKYRTYTGLPESTSSQRKIEAPIGTNVKVRVRANCKVKDGTIRFQYPTDKNDKKDNKESSSKVYLLKSPSDPTLLEASFVLAQSGNYQIEFTSADRDEYADSMPAIMVAVPDYAPIVDLFMPGKESTAPVNGMLNLEGKITDDFGINKLTLKMIASGDRPLRAQPYRDEKSLKLPAGGNLSNLIYKDFIDFSTLQAQDGLPYKPTSGSFVDYWVEAEDACDFPKFNLGKSKVYRLTFADQAPEDQAKKEKEKAQQDKKQNEQKQDENLKKENQQREDQKKNPPEQKNPDEKEQPGQQGDKSDGKQNPDKAAGGNGGDGKGQEKSKNDQKGAGSPQPQDKSDNNDSKNDPQMNPQAGEQNFKDQEQKLNEALAKNNKDNPNKDNNDPKGGDPKGGDPKGGDPKGGDPKGMDGKDKNKEGTDSKNKDGKSTDNKGNQPKGTDSKAGEDKSQPKNGADSKGNDPANMKKESTDSKNADAKAGDSKAGDSKAGDSKAGDSKAGDSKAGDSKAGDSKAGDSKAGDSKAGDSKSKDPKGMDEKGGALKSGDKGKPGEAKDGMGKDGKQAGDKGKPTDAKDGDGKGKEGDAKGKEGDGKGKEGAGKEGMGKEGDGKGKDGMSKDGKQAGDKGKPTDAKDGKEGDGKGKEGDGKGKEGDGKEGMGKGKPGDGKEGEGKDGAGKDGAGKDGKGKPGGGDQPGLGGTGDRNSPDAPGVANPNARKETEEADQENKRKAVQAQLENYKKSINKDVLKDAKMSPEDLERFLQEKKRRLEADLGVKEKDAPSQNNGKGPSLGGKRFEPNSTEKIDTRAPNLAKPPAAYRDAYKEFTKKLAQPEN